MAASQSFTTFEQNHLDVVLAVDFNFYGTRMATASADHRVKVFDRKEDNWNLVDTFGAHDAEITDIKWHAPFMGEILGTIAEDGRFKLWQEDLTELPLSGRRFTCIFRMTSQTRVPFMSLAFKHIHTESYLALTTRDGYLQVLEPNDHEDLTQWHVLFEKYLCPTPERTEETSFKVAWHAERFPNWEAVRVGLDRKALSLAVTCMNSVKIWRTDKDRRFYQAAEFREARDLVRDVAWANGSMRGWDVIATAGMDGCLRIYELHVEGSAGGSESFGSASMDSTVLEKSPNSALKQGSNMKKAETTRSGIGAGLAGSSASVNVDREQRNRDGDASAPGRIKESATMVEEINLRNGAIWKVAFSHDGSVLASTGDDGIVRTWKRALSGRWLEYAEVEVAND